MSRHDGQSTRLRRRPSRTVPALIVAILLLAAGVALAWLTIAHLIDGTWSTLLQGPRDWLTGLTWNDPAMWGIGAGAVIAGVILLLCAFIPGGFSALTVRNAATAGTSDEPAGQDRETVITRRAVAHLAKAESVEVDGVSSASTTATHNRVHISVKTTLRDPGDLRARVTEAVRDRLNDIGVDPLPRISTSIETKH